MSYPQDGCVAVTAVKKLRVEGEGRTEGSWACDLGQSGRSDFGMVRQAEVTRVSTEQK